MDKNAIEQKRQTVRSLYAGLDLEGDLKKIKKQILLENSKFGLGEDGSIPFQPTSVYSLIDAGPAHVRGLDFNTGEEFTFHASTPLSNPNRLKRFSRDDVFYFAFESDEQQFRVNSEGVIYGDVWGSSARFFLQEVDESHLIRIREIQKHFGEVISNRPNVYLRRGAGTIKDIQLGARVLLDKANSALRAQLSDYCLKRIDLLSSSEALAMVKNTFSSEDLPVFRVSKGYPIHPEELQIFEARNHKALQEVRSNIPLRKGIAAVTQEIRRLQGLLKNKEQEDQFTLFDHDDLLVVEEPEIRSEIVIEQEFAPDETIAQGLLDVPSISQEANPEVQQASSAIFSQLNQKKTEIDTQESIGLIEDEVDLDVEYGVELIDDTHQTTSMAPVSKGEDTKSRGAELQAQATLAMPKSVSGNPFASAVKSASSFTQVESIDSMDDDDVFGLPARSNREEIDAQRVPVRSIEEIAQLSTQEDDLMGLEDDILEACDIQTNKQSDGEAWAKIASGSRMPS